MIFPFWEHVEAFIKALHYTKVIEIIALVIAIVTVILLVLAVMYEILRLFV